jgi:hypothetical protein
MSNTELVAGGKGLIALGSYQNFPILIHSPPNAGAPSTTQLSP